MYIAFIAKLRNPDLSIVCITDREMDLGMHFYLFGQILPGLRLPRLCFEIILCLQIKNREQGLRQRDTWQSIMKDSTPKGPTCTCARNDSSAELCLFILYLFFVPVCKFVLTPAQHITAFGYISRPIKSRLGNLPCPKYFLRVMLHRITRLMTFGLLLTTTSLT